MISKICKGLHWFIKHGGASAIISVVILIVLYAVNGNSGGETVAFLDYTVFCSVITALIVQILGNMLSKVFLNLLEDNIKLESNYEKLVKRYVGKFFSFKNKNADEANYKKLCKKKKSAVETAVFPIILDCELNNKSFNIVDSTEMYTLPSVFEENYQELLEAHITSNTYNQLNVRVCSWQEEDGVFSMKTMRTTFFNSLVTNRSMDFVWKNGLTTRDFCQYGPFMPTLEESILSNHLGFNGFIESSDGYIPFIKRNRDVSIGKSTYGTSIGASLKTKYALENENAPFNCEGLKRAIVKEISDELKIEEIYLADFDISSNIIAAYRDLVEGGKPQLLFYYRVNQTKDKINDNFVKELKKNLKRKQKTPWNKELKQLEDGKKLVWIHKDELKKSRTFQRLSCLR